MSDRDRTWFQTMKQRKTEKDRLDTKFKEAEAAKNATANGGVKRAGDDLSKLSESKRKKKEEAQKTQTPSQLAKQRFVKAKESASYLRAKASKIAHKQKRIRQIDDVSEKKQPMRNKKESRFSVDLTNTGRRNAKKLRYVSTMNFLRCFIFTIVFHLSPTGSKQIRQRNRPNWMRRRKRAK